MFGCISKFKSLSCKTAQEDTKLCDSLFGSALDDPVACAYSKNAKRAFAQARAWTKLQPFTQAYYWEDSFHSPVIIHV
jgi:hypothetical protein